jgi:tRNA nucleotidyltransferase/poly(A) polymerase
MPVVDLIAARRFAIDVVCRLRGAGYEALWAGGCVRDQLMGLQPKDYDVATSATPDQVRQVFGYRWTLAVGAAFGVIVVRGPRHAGTIDVATFRRDSQYSDGRHPDHVTFSTAQEDAQRRDFTINGLFFDPLAERVIDYVNGQQDLLHKLIRAIGDPHQRFAEDKLRMLRAIRFAATFDFQLDPDTLTAIQQHAHEMHVVSAERIAAELRRMLVDAHRVRAVRLLHESALLPVILPESIAVWHSESDQAGGTAPDAWQRTLRTLELLEEPTFAVALAALLREYCSPPSDSREAAGSEVALHICRRWKLSNEDTYRAVWLLENERLVRSARGTAWPQLQRLLIADGAGELLTFAAAVAQVVDGTTAEIDYCRQRLAVPYEHLNPPPLIDGEDLKAAGIPPGPIFKQLLDAIRDAQLEQQIMSKDDALARAHQIWQSSRPSAE